MRYRALFFIIACLTSVCFTTSLAFADGSNLSAGDPFFKLIVTAAGQLKGLCDSYPDHPYCGAESQAGVIDRAPSLKEEGDLLGTVTQISENVFQIQEKHDPKSPDYFPVLTAEERASYFSKMEYLNEMSDTQDQLQHQLVSLIVLQLTTEWIDIYGDPFREKNIGVDETGRLLPMHANSEHNEERQKVAGNEAALVDVSGLVVLKASQKIAEFLLQNTKYLTVMFRLRLPINVVGGMALVAAPLLPGAGSYIVGRDNVRRILNSKDILPSPAHLVTFGFNADLNMVGEDVKAQWATKEQAVYERAVDEGAPFGAMLFVDILTRNFGSKVVAYLAAKGLGRTAKLAQVATTSALSPQVLAKAKYLRYGKYVLDVSPLDLVAMVSVDEIMDVSTFHYHLHRFRSDLEAAAKAGDTATVYETLGNIIRLYVKSTEFVEGTIATEKALMDYAMMDGTNASFYELVEKRTNLAQQMDPINFPSSTGALILKKSLCDSTQIVPRPTPDQWTEDQLEMASEYINSMGTSLSKFKSSADEIASFFDSEIPNLREAHLDQAAQMLTNYAQKFASLRGRAQNLLDRYPSIFDDYHGVELAASALRNVEDIEWHHHADFPDRTTAYYCKVKDQN